MQLCTLSDVKTILGVSDTSQDAKLQLFIDLSSAQIQRYLGYPCPRTDYTSEAYAINNNQLLYLRQAAIQAVSAVTIQGVTILQGGDDGWQATTFDLLAGRLYRGVGWCGRYFVRGMMYDPVAGARDILVSYTAGWYLPGDANYVQDDPASLPYELTSAALQSVVERYRVNSVGAEGFVQYKEGGVAAMIEQKSAPGGVPEVVDGSGLSETAKGIVNPWRRWIVA